jgi:putative redox protein
MADDSAPRADSPVPAAPADPTGRVVRVERTSTGRYEARNVRGATVRIGTGGAQEFTPVELMLAALGACTAVDVDTVTSRRVEPDRFVVTVSATKARDESGGSVLRDLLVSLDLAFPDGAGGDTARQALPRVLAISHDRSCTVSRTIEAGTQVAVEVAGDGAAP